MSRSLARTGLLALLALLAAPAARVDAATAFNSNLDLALSVPGGAIENKFGFATSFPRPADSPPPGPAAPNPGGATSGESAGGGVFTLDPLVPNSRYTVAGGRGMQLQTGGTTNALPVDGSYAVGEGWQSGRMRFRLGNFTGRPGLPAAEGLKIDLKLDAIEGYLASATNDLNPLDLATAKYSYQLVNATTGDVLYERTEQKFSDNDAEAAKGPAAIANPQMVSVTMPADTFYNIELFGHVYAAGTSKGLGFPFTPTPSVTQVQQRMNTTLPDQEMQMQPHFAALFGDALGFGDWRLASVSGVTGEDPFARQGLNTITLETVATSPHVPYDMEIAVETPVDGFSQLAIDHLLVPAGGMHAGFYDLQVGHGVGEDFQLSLDPVGLSLAGPNSQLPPQELSGAMQVVGANDPHMPTQMALAGHLMPGQPGQLQLAANLHDAIDGVIDGMARFTLRQTVEGIAGDYDMNAQVDGGDRLLWEASYGSNDFLADGDANGVVGGGDLLNWQRHLGTGLFDGGPPQSAMTHSVPEPAAMLLGLLGGVGILATRRRR